MAIDDEVTYSTIYENIELMCAVVRAVREQVATNHIESTRYESLVPDRIKEGTTRLEVLITQNKVGVLVTTLIYTNKGSVSSGQHRHGGHTLHATLHGTCDPRCTCIYIFGI